MDSPLSQVPYFLEAMRNWAHDAGFTPHILIDSFSEGVVLPDEILAKGDRLILLNIHCRAIQDFHINNEWAVFSARFGSKYHQVDLPLESIISIIVPESSDKVVFRTISVNSPENDSPDQEPQLKEQSGKRVGSKRSAAKTKSQSHLTLVK